MHLTIYIQKETRELIEEEVKRIGCGSSVSGFISTAAQEKITRIEEEKEIFDELDKYIKSFPRENIKDFVKRLKKNYKK